MRTLQLGAGNLFGGIEVCQQTLAKNRDSADGMVQEYAYCFPGKAADAIRAAAAPVHILGGVRYRRPWTILAARKALATLLENVRYDVVLCHGVWAYGLFAPTVRRKRLPLVLWVHDRHGSGGVFERLARRTPPDFIISNSAYSAATLPEFLPGVPSRVIYCPVGRDEDVPAQAREDVRLRFDTGPDAVVALQIGRWEPHKGHLFHLEALARIRDIPNWVCWQVGSPQRSDEHTYFEEVQAAARRLGIADRVRFLGWQPDLESLRAAADIYCQPNVRPEPFGLTLVEALSARLPVVASAEAGPLEIVNSECGILVKPASVDELARALRTLASNADTRRRLGNHGPARARELCDPPAQVRKLEDCLRAQFGPS